MGRNASGRLKCESDDFYSVISCSEQRIEGKKRRIKKSPSPFQTLQNINVTYSVSNEKAYNHKLLHNSDFSHIRICSATIRASRAESWVETFYTNCMMPKNENYTKME